jgi:hypothetical protein
VRAVRAAERVVHVDVGQRRELLGERGIVLLLGRVKPEVLEQQHAAGGERADRRHRRPAGRSRRRGRFPAT